MDDLAKDIGLKDRKLSKLRQRVERAFKAVRKAHGAAGRGLDIHFANVRGSRFAMQAVTIRCVAKGKRGRVRITNEKLSKFEQRMDRVERRKQRAEGY